MKRLVIAIDCDDVLVHTTPYFVKAYNEQYGTHGTLEDAPDVYSPVWEADPETIIDRWTKLTETAEYKALEPSDNEVEILKRLANTHELHLVTARKEDERLHTLQMINRKLSNVFTSLEFVGWGGSKGQVCRNINADVLIDDSYRNLKDAIEHGLPIGGAILFGALPATQTHKDEDNIVYCQDWLAVEQHVTRLADS